jgi:hypothetical protein
MLNSNCPILVRRTIPESANLCRIDQRVLNSVGPQDFLGRDRLRIPAPDHSM